jgi:hypothetical protein
MNTDHPPPSDLPTTAQQEAIRKAASNLTGRARAASMNAFKHLRLAWKLRDTDANMAALRAITAEEEAASAVIYLAQQKGYRGAHKLNFRDHIHKASIFPFICAVGRAIENSGIADIKIGIDPVSPKIFISFALPQSIQDETGQTRGEPDHPLNLAINIGTTASNVVLFEDELAKMLNIAKPKTVRDVFEEIANLRNKLLYATDDGAYVIDIDRRFIEEKQRRVCILIGVAICISQTPVHQLLVAQSIKGLLQSLAKPHGDIDMPVPDEAPMRIDIINSGETTTHRISFSVRTSGRHLIENLYGKLPPGPHLLSGRSFWIYKRPKRVS